MKHYAILMVLAMSTVIAVILLNKKWLVHPFEKSENWTDTSRNLLIALVEIAVGILIFFKVALPLLATSLIYHFDKSISFSSRFEKMIEMSSISSLQSGGLQFLLNDYCFLASVIVGSVIVTSKCNSLETTRWHALWAVPLMPFSHFIMGLVVDTEVGFKRIVSSEKARLKKSSKAQNSSIFVPVALEVGYRSLIGIAVVSFFISGVIGLFFDQEFLPYFVAAANIPHISSSLGIVATSLSAIYLGAILRARRAGESWFVREQVIILSLLLLAPGLYFIFPSQYLRTEKAFIDFAFIPDWKCHQGAKLFNDESKFVVLDSKPVFEGIPLEIGKNLKSGDVVRICAVDVVVEGKRTSAWLKKTYDVSSSPTNREAFVYRIEYN